jgi:two-component sensor histidine kinase
MNITIYQMATKLRLYRVKWLCVLAFFLCTSCSILAQDLAFLPDSTKRALASLPESIHDSIYSKMGTALYAQFTDEGYSQALDCFNKALYIAEKYDHQKDISYLYHSIGNVYDAQGDQPSQILYYYKKSYDLHTSLNGDEAIKLTLAYDVAHAYNLMHDSVQSMSYLKLVDAFKNEAFGNGKDPERWDRVSLLVAYLTMKNNNIKGFLNLFEAQNKARVYVNGRFPYARYLAICSWRYAFEKGNYPKAIETIMAELEKTKTDSSILMQYLARAYFKNNNFKEAYYWSNLLNEFDSKNTKAKHQKDLVVKLLKTENLSKEKEKIFKEKQNQYLIWGMFLSLLAAGVTTYFWYANHKSKLELAKRNEEKIILVNEIHHRVKNNLQLLYGLAKLQLPTITDEKARDLWQKNLSQLKAMSLVNEKLYNTEGVTSVVLSDFIAEILGHFKQIQGINGVPDIKTDIVDNLTVSADFAVPFGLILSELITNSYKYAFNEGISAIFINVSNKDKNAILFSYTDSGKMADTAILLKKKTGGSALIRDLVRQLQGTLIISNENNLKYNFALPI